MRKLLCLFLFLVAASVLPEGLRAQNINGPSTPQMGFDHIYYVTSTTLYTDYTFVITSGSGIIKGKDHQGDNYGASVTWTGMGPGTLKFIVNGSTVLGQINVTVMGCSSPAATPVATFSSTVGCATGTISYTGTPPANNVWYWQTSPTGTDKSYSTTSRTVTSTTSLYLRAYVACSGLWGTAASAGTLTVKSVPATPAVPTVSTNACGPKVVTKAGTSTGTLYWQTTANGVDNSPAANAHVNTYTVSAHGSKTIFIRDLGTNGCWSSAQSKTVSVDNPNPPNPAQITYCEWEHRPITTTGYLSTMRWYNEADEAQRQGTEYDPGLSAIGEHKYWVRSLSAAGCLSADRSLILLTVKNCDDQLNWVQSTSYGLNADGTPKAIAASKTYQNGLGSPLQTQEKSYANNQVLAIQPLYDNAMMPVAATLPAPINASDFEYHYGFVTSASSTPYGAADFDNGPGTTLGEVFNPKPVTSMGKGSLGWYYSTLNNLEPLTPRTTYPYVREYTPPGPDPKIVYEAAAGNTMKMGSGHTNSTERITITTAELTHYFGWRSQVIPGATAPLGLVGYKYITTDPDGKRSAVFEDAEGRTLASALVTGSTGTNPVVYTYDQWSYNYYNAVGQLIATVAPNGITPTATAPTFVTTYKYDHMGNVMEINSPDEGRTQYVYSTDGTLRFSQNQEQFNATPQRFNYANYDIQGRLVETGEYAMSGTDGFVFETVTVVTPSTNSVLNVVDARVPKGYDIDLLPTSGFPGPSKKLDATRCVFYTFFIYDFGRGLPDDDDNAHRKQYNLHGRLARSQSAQTTTFYSYDEFGQLAWTKQEISGLSRAKSVDYMYDFSGNVIRVAYQKGRSEEDFYHHYVYDEDARLKEVYTSLDSVNMTLQAKYYYYLHGPLKRVELASSTCKQGVDYVYTINGQLKGINSSDPTADPGRDGITGSANAANPKDFFGQTMHYSSDDYTGGYATPVTLGADFQNQYGGNLQGISYVNMTDVGRRHVNGYKYDNLNRLTDAQWGNVSGSTAVFPAMYPNRENISLYDRNGNIMTLNRNRKDGVSSADYSYVYEANTNRLDKVTQAGANVVDYAYNTLGQMTQQNEGAGKIRNVKYDALGLVAEIRNASNNKVEQFLRYNDAGDLVRKLDYKAGVLAKTTYYVRDVSGSVMAIYEQKADGEPVLMEIPLYGLSRLGMYKPSGTNGFYRYEMTDHLGNVRAVCAQPVSTIIPTVTFETDNQEDAENNFENYSSFVNDIVDHTDAGAVYEKVQTLNGGTNGRVGLAKTLDVSPGDQVTIEAYAKYRTFEGDNDTPLAPALAAAFGVSGASTGEQLKIYNGLNAYAATVPEGQHTGDDDTPPKMFVTILLFDKNYELLDATWHQVDTAGNQEGVKKDPPHSYMSATYTVKQPGYAYLFISNENPTNAEAYFDDVTVTHIQSPIVAGSDYYPFGLPMDGTEITDERYRYGYQGQFSEKDSLSGWNTFELRMYDARFGRWLSADPYGQYASPYVGMGDAPHQSVDPDGGWNSMAAFGVGFIAGGVTSAYIAKENGANMRQAMLLGLGGGILGGITGIALNNMGSFPGVDLSKVDPGALRTTSKTITVLISNSGGKSIEAILKGDGGKLGGHVAIVVDDVVYGFTSDKDNVDKSFLNTDSDGDGYNRIGVKPDTWHSKGKITEDQANDPTLAGANARFDIPVTDEQKSTIKKTLAKIALNPPDYQSLRVRCTSVAARVLRSGNVIGGGSRFFQESPFQFRRYMSRKFGKYKVY